MMPFLLLSAANSLHLDIVLKYCFTNNWSTMMTIVITHHLSPVSQNHQGSSHPYLPPLIPTLLLALSLPSLLPLSSAPSLSLPPLLAPSPLYFRPSLSRSLTIFLLHAHSPSLFPLNIAPSLPPFLSLYLTLYLHPFIPSSFNHVYIRLPRLLIHSTVHCNNSFEIGGLLLYL